MVQGTTAVEELLALVLGDTHEADDDPRGHPRVYIHKIWSSLEHITMPMTGIVSSFLATTQEAQ